MVAEPLLRRGEVFIDAEELNRLHDLTADLFFISAIRVGADTTFTRLLPLENLRTPLAPNAHFSQRILLALQSMG